jgi:hypothetical protein
MRPIGFSTGALALSDFHLALEELQGQPVDSIELSALRYRELGPLLRSLSELTLSSYKYISIHAPSSFDADQEMEIVNLLRRFVPASWPIVLHPDTVHDFSVWRTFGKQLAIENMDRRKPIGRTVEELKTIFEKVPDASLCFDIGHARQCDTTMTEASRILRSYADRLCQIHVSEVNTASHHDPLSFASVQAFAEVADLIPSWVPVILEARVTQSQIKIEIERAQKALRVLSVRPALV